MRDLDLGDEAIAPDNGRQLGFQSFQRDLPLVLHIVGQVDRGHAALAEFSLDRVAALKGGVQAGDGIGHGVKMCLRRVRPQEGMRRLGAPISPSFRTRRASFALSRRVHDRTQSGHTLPYKGSAAGPKSLAALGVPGWALLESNQ